MRGGAVGPLTLPPPAQVDGLRIAEKRCCSFATGSLLLIGRPNCQEVDCCWRGAANGSCTSAGLLRKQTDSGCCGLASGEEL